MFDGQAGEEAQFDQFSFLRVLSGQLFERIVEREEFVIRKGSSDLDLVQILTGHAAAMAPTSTRPARNASKRSTSN